MLTTFIGRLLAVQPLAILLSFAPSVSPSSKSSNSRDDLLRTLEPVDLLSFRNLISPAEQDYLRTQLTPEDFRRIQRARISATADYTALIAHNAEIVLLLARLGKHAETAEEVRAAWELYRKALRLRLNCLLTIAPLGVGMLAPRSKLRLRRIADEYEHVRARTMHLTRLHMPYASSRVERSL